MHYHTNSSVFFREEPRYEGGKTFVFNHSSGKLIILPIIGSFVLRHLKQPLPIEDLKNILTTYIRDNDLGEDYLESLLCFIESLVDIGVLIKEPKS